MCGITGFVDFDKLTNKQNLELMTSSLAHRGPDSSGILFNKAENYNIGLGHRRLSIIDLSSGGQQPMSFENITIIYNGEIYNFAEVKAYLIKLGYSFNSNSDTEVILKSYHKWGIECLSKFNGMFAIAIYDKKQNKLFIIRDRTGVKPLYYYIYNRSLYFSSELKVFHQLKYFDKTISENGFYLYRDLGYIPEPHTIFKDTFKLKAGHFLTINLETTKIAQTKYWDIAEFYHKPQLKISENEALEKIEILLKSAFNYRMVSDVPVGSFLSGGYDSSLVTAMLQQNMNNKLSTFSIGFHERAFNEAGHAKKIADYLSTDHHENYCTAKDALDIIPNLSYVYDEPLADSSTIPTMLVSKFASQHVKVCLSSDGGDELFGGYNKYDTNIKLFNLLNKYPKWFKKAISYSLNKIGNSFKLNHLHSNKLSKLSKILKEKDIEKFMQLLSSLNFYPFTKNTKVITNFDNKNSSSDIFNRMLCLDYKTYLVDDILTKIDRATMSYGLEGREPLLDYRIAEFVARLPSNLKYKNNDKKYLLKKIAHKYIPKKMLDRPKQGFSSPINNWLKEELKDLMIDYLSEHRLKNKPFFDAKTIIKMRDCYLKTQNNNLSNSLASRLWTVIVFEMWYEKWKI